MAAGRSRSRAALAPADCRKPTARGARYLLVFSDAMLVFMTCS